MPTDYRIFDIDTEGKTKNDYFSEMLLAAHNRGFSPPLVCFDSWYASIENLKLVRSLSWHFLTRLKSNRKVNPEKTGLKPVFEIFISEAGRTVWLSGFGLVKVFRLIDKDGNAQHWATSILEMNGEERNKLVCRAMQIEQYHRWIKQFCLIERSQARRRRPWQNHILLCFGRF